MMKLFIRIRRILMNIANRHEDDDDDDQGQECVVQ